MAMSTTRVLREATIRSKGRYAKLEGTCVRLAYLTWW